MEENKPKRYRRTKADIENGINRAAKEVILKKGFSGMKVLDIIKGANIEPITFYARYKNQEDFYDSFVREYDYWFKDILKIPDDKLYTAEGYIEIFGRLFDCLKDDSVMLELLRWEVNEANAVTRHTAMNRELHTLPLVAIYEVLFKDSGIDFVAISSLLIGGVYYLNLHRGCSPFCGIDVSTEEGRRRLQNAVEGLAVKLFSYSNMTHRKQDDGTKKSSIAERMRMRGISEEDISYCLSVLD